MHLPFGRQRVGLGHKQIEQLCHHPSCLAGHAIDLVVPPHIREQEVADRFKVARHLRAEGDDRLSGTADVVCRTGTQTFQIG